MDPSARYYGAAAEYNKPKGFGFNRRLLTIIGIAAGVLLLLVIILNIFSALGSAPRQNLERLTARLQALQEFSAKNQPTISDNDLAKLNSEITTYAASDATSLKTYLQSRFGAEVPKDIATEEADTNKEALAEAQQAGRFNETYRQLLGEKIAASLQLAGSLNEGANAQLKAILAQTTANLVAIEDQL